MSAASPSSPRPRRSTATKGAFGFDPRINPHHFKVEIPSGATAEVEISEHHTFDLDKGVSSPVSLGERADGQLRVRLARLKWDRIADSVRAHFNARLKAEGLPSGTWGTKANHVRRDLGKELVVLAWALEDADPSLCGTAIANWMGLVAEERWWLYTQTAAATGRAMDRNVGWRKALRFALTETPTPRSETPTVPDYFRQAEALLLFDRSTG